MIWYYRAAAASDEGCEVEIAAPAPADPVEVESNVSSASDINADNVESDETCGRLVAAKVAQWRRLAKEDATAPVAGPAESPPKVVAAKAAGKRRRIDTCVAASTPALPNPATASLFSSTMWLSTTRWRGVRSGMPRSSC